LLNLQRQLGAADQIDLQAAVRARLLADHSAPRSGGQP
jgi:hypothetical protein